MSLFSKDRVGELFTSARNALLLEAQAMGVPARQLACTALLAIVGTESSAFAQIGDGAIVAGVGDELRVLFWPAPSEYVNTTDFLTDETYLTAIQCGVVSERLTDLAILTDGLQRLALDFQTQTPYRAFFAPMFRQLRSGLPIESLRGHFHSFLDSVAVNARTDDDKTLVIASRRDSHEIANTD